VDGRERKAETDHGKNAFGNKAAEPTRRKRKTAMNDFRIRLLLFLAEKNNQAA
jgi:hypothetical protein